MRRSAARRRRPARTCPCPGSHPSRTEKPMIRSRPTQNAGMLMPIIATTWESRSRPRAPSSGGEHAHRARPSGNASSRAPRRQDQGGVESSPQLGQHGPAQHDGAAEVAVERVREPSGRTGRAPAGRARAARAGRRARRRRRRCPGGSAPGRRGPGGSEEHDERHADEDEERRDQGGASSVACTASIGAGRREDKASRAAVKASHRDGTPRNPERELIFPRCCGAYD